MKHLTIFILSILLATAVFAQKPDYEQLRMEEVEEHLDAYAIKNPKLKSKRVSLNLKRISIQDYATAITEEAGISLTIDPAVEEGKVITTLKEASPHDIILNLCKFHNLTVDFSGSIIELRPYVPPVKKEAPKKLGVNFNAFNNKLELDLKNDTLDMVLKSISSLTGKNVIAVPGISDMKVNGFIGKTDFEKALRQLAKRNGLELEEDEDGFWVFSKPAPVKPGTKSTSGTAKGRKGSGSSKRKSSGAFSINCQSATDSTEALISVEAFEGKLSDIILDVSDKAKVEYYLYTEMPETVTIKAKDLTYVQFLDKILQGTKYEYKENDGVYMIGDVYEDQLVHAEMIQLQHRSVKELLQQIPEDLQKTNIKIKEFHDLNAFVVSGTQSQIKHLREFIEKIDRPVPVVTIELMICDITKRFNVQTGLEAGIAPEPVQAGGQLFPGVDFTFSSGGVNKLLGWLAGNGVVNLGQVSPNFYVSMKAIEESGVIKVRQKPRLSTLNGQTASLTNGETVYYVNETNNAVGSLSPVVTTTRNFEAVEANFDFQITPFVSGNEQVTLDIEVNQASFTGQLQPNAPPPTVNRNITSSIRVKNGEMIVLGGLESVGIEEEGSGVPLLQRIPVLKWFVSKRKRTRSKSKLVIFVKTSITY